MNTLPNLNKPKYFREGLTTKVRLKKLTDTIIKETESNVKALLHASRDALRNHKEDTTKISLSCNCPWYCEAFGIMRTLEFLRYGRLASSNLSAVEHGFSDEPRQNLRWWFCELEKQVLEEEGFRGNKECDYCLNKYGKDDSGRRKFS